MRSTAATTKISLAATLFVLIAAGAKPANAVGPKGSANATTASRHIWREQNPLAENDSAIQPSVTLYSDWGSNINTSISLPSTSGKLTITPAIAPGKAPAPKPNAQNELWGGVPLSLNF